ncbi:t-SNARE [Dioszegia hungarica]|uniref:t-SNARE n=1 Tax=Dioszegia hungarica TaxID=4972 RepID=A0AA38H7N7_9TREE|nr:t-SNARE [Dioszegia hungarica]KAI9635452.1 t-SNARE [Dioszegia hungarica]
MSRDPYLDVKGDVESNLSTLHTLLTSQERIRSQSSSRETPAARQAADEISRVLDLLEGDLEDLDESVRAVEAVGDRWGIGEGEKKGRRAFVERVKREVQGLRRKITSNSRGGKGKAPAKYTDNPDADLERGDEDVEETRRWEMEEQQTLMRRQDDTLGVISGTLHTLASQAGLIGNEVNEQSEMLDDLSTRVDTTDSRLRKATRQLNDFIRRNEETKSGWCICILIFVLIILLVAVILT